MKTKLLLIGTLLTCLSAFGATWVMAQSGETLRVCATKGGSIRIIAEPDTCRKNETSYELYASTVVDALLGDEAAARLAADVALQADIDDEAGTRSAADVTLQDNIDAEAADRLAADVTLQDNIDAEADARSAADDALKDNIDAIDMMVKADPPCFDNTNRYVDCGNGTVHDTVTNLIWLHDANCYGKLDYAAANNAAAGLEHGECGLTDGSSPGDWRLPTWEEWQTTVARAVEMNCAVPPSEPPYLTNTPGTACYSAGPKAFTGVQSDRYWASTSMYDFPNSADYVNLHAGHVGTWRNKAGAEYVWPVRGGQ